EAVIGIGGISAKQYKIDKKISWVGIYPIKINCNSLKGPIIIFKYLIDYGTEGKLVEEIAPLLYKRFFKGRARLLSSGMSKEENMEAQKIITYAGNESKVNNIESLIKIAKTKVRGLNQVKDLKIINAKHYFFPRLYNE